MTAGVDIAMFSQLQICQVFYIQNCKKIRKFVFDFWGKAVPIAHNAQQGVNTIVVCVGNVSKVFPCTFLHNTTIVFKAFPCNFLHNTTIVCTPCLCIMGTISITWAP